MHQSDLGLLHQALGLVRAGDAAAAGACLAQLSAAAQAHPDALYVAALAADGMGRFDAAEHCFTSAIAAAPANPAYWNGYGAFLARQQRLGDAIAALRRAVAAAPGHGEAWSNLALMLLDRLDLAEADAALARAEALAPAAQSNPALLAARGALAQAQGDEAAARAALGRAVAAAPGDAAARLRLSRALAAQGDTAAALAAVAPAETPELAAQCGDILVEAGQLDAAINAYRATIARWPGHAPAMSALAFLLPQTTAVAGLPKPAQCDAALAHFDAALGRGAAPDVWLAALEAARGLGDGPRLITWAEQGRAALGDQPMLAAARLTGLRLTGAHGQALAEARSLAARYPGQAVFASHRAWNALRLRELAEAEAAAIDATRAAPREQGAWALLATIWRITGDPRGAWLLDHDRLVMVADLATPRGWASLPAFLADLAAELERRHVMHTAPPEQTLRGGTQTHGTLLAATHPVIIAFRDALRATVEHCLAGLSPQPGHPFLGRLTGRIRFAGSWSVRLAGQGYHVSHVHPEGWLSSAFYVALPPEVGVDGDAGKLVFGVPDDALGLDLAPQRIVTPAPGRLAIFPSYAWHGTVPFQSPTARLTAAFDALPG